MSYYIASCSFGKDEDGFPAINVIVPPDEWNMNEAE